MVSLDSARSSRRIGPGLLRIAHLAAVMFAFAVVWWPELRAHWAAPLLVSSDIVAMARMSPPDALLEGIARQRLGLPLYRPGPPDGRHPSITTVADRLLEGSVHFPRMPPASIIVPFDKRNLVTGPPTHQLYVASLATADILVRAYRQSGEEHYLRAAGREVSEFAKVDRWRLLPIGLLWNDHALAATVPVLVDYWAAVRHRADLDPAHARDVLSLVSRTATRLARPENYTFRTNHGLMQSLALLQIAAAFPSLNTAKDLRALACTRIAEQSEYYLSPEGPVLEHSAGYHMLGLYLFRILDDLGPDLGCQLTQEARRALDLARRFASLLRRPDGTLPSLGDTDLAESYDASLAGSESPVSATGLYPASGFFVRWDGLEGWPASSTLGQTVMTWSNAPTRAHKRADDLGMLIWAQGEDWLVHTGYWPFGHVGEQAARGWRGSNAPHLDGEPIDPPERAVLLGYAESNRVWGIDVERSTGMASSSVRRQVVAIDGRMWLIADSGPKDTDLAINSVWTFAPGKRINTLSPTRYGIRSASTGRVAHFTVLPAKQVSTKPLRGSLEPFAGWVVRNGIPTATESIAVRNAGSPLTLMILRLGEENEEAAPSGPPVLDEHSVADHWGIEFPQDRRVARLTYRNGLVGVQFTDGSLQELELRAGHSEAEATRASIVAAYERAALRNHRIPYLIPYRFRVTWILLGLLVAQELAFMALRRRTPRVVPAARLVTGIAWVAVGLLAANWYLVR